jgi:hypothetical protein
MAILSAAAGHVVAVPATPGAFLARGDEGAACFVAPRGAVTASKLVAVFSHADVDAARHATVDDVLVGADAFARWAASIVGADAREGAHGPTTRG